jgi:hypothetical protein
MCEGECSNHVEESYESFHQEEGIIVVQAIINNLFEEALGFLVSSEYGGGHVTTEEESTSVARGPHEARLRGSRNLKDVRRSRPSDLATRHDHPLHLHTLRSIPSVGFSS